MAGIKRKEHPHIIGRTHETVKKVKTESRKKVRPITPPSDLEAQTDSDPIVESDTTEHSGDDNGVSWPSDDEEEDSPEIRNGTKSSVNGVESSNHSKSLGKVAEPKSESNGASHNRESILFQLSLQMLTSLKPRRLKKHMRNKRLSLKNARLLSQTRTQ